MGEKKKRFWLGDPDLFETDDDDPGGHLQPDDDGTVYLARDGSQPRKETRRSRATKTRSNLRGGRKTR